MSGSRPIARFVLRVFLLLVPCFALWWYLGPLWAAPAMWAADALLTGVFADSVQSVQLSETTLTVLSTLGERGGELLPAREAGNRIAFAIDNRVLSYALPFFAALHFATPAETSWERFLGGTVVLWLLLTVGLVATALRELMLGLGPVFLAQPGVPPANGIALVYQFCTLIVPPVAPVLLWAYGARDVPAFRALLPSAMTGGDAAARSRQGLPSQRR